MSRWDRNTIDDPYQPRSIARKGKEPPMSIYTQCLLVGGTLALLAGLVALYLPAIVAALVLILGGVHTCHVDKDGL